MCGFPALGRTPSIDNNSGTLFFIFVGEGLTALVNSKQQAPRNSFSEVVFRFTFRYNTKR